MPRIFHPNDLKDIALLTPCGKKYRENPKYREEYLNRIKQKKYCEICNKCVQYVNFARHCRGKKHIKKENTLLTYFSEK